MTTTMLMAMMSAVMLRADNSHFRDIGCATEVNFSFDVIVGWLWWRAIYSLFRTKNEM